MVEGRQKQVLLRGGEQNPVSRAVTEPGRGICEVWCQKGLSHLSCQGGKKQWMHSLLVPGESSRRAAGGRGIRSQSHEAARKVLKCSRHFPCCVKEFVTAKTRQKETQPPIAQQTKQTKDYSCDFWPQTAQLLLMSFLCENESVEQRLDD